MLVTLSPLESSCVTEDGSWVTSGPTEYVADGEWNTCVMAIAKSEVPHRRSEVTRRI